MHPGRRRSRWLCREHAPWQAVNPHAARCANYGVCGNEVDSLTQLNKPKDRRFCDTCKAARRVGYWRVVPVVMPAVCDATRLLECGDDQWYVQYYDV